MGTVAPQSANFTNGSYKPNAVRITPNTTNNTVNNAVNNTNKTNNTTPTTHADAGLDQSVLLIIAICGISAVYAYKKIREY